MGKTNRGTPLPPDWGDASRKQQLRRRLLVWFADNARDLPWRKSRDPYSIWISEIMLQQTQVVSVCDYFTRFLERFPTALELAAAPESEVLRYWEGLGYYRRARQLHAAAQQIVAVHGGEFPRDFDQILALPGIGRYTAGAISSIAFDERAPILEANTVRLFSRLMLLRETPSTSAAQKQLWAFAAEILPRKNTGAFNQALMELGAEVCRPRGPDCEACPVATLCPTFAARLQDQIPAPKKKVQYEDVTEAAIVVTHGQRVLLRRRSAGERWAGLWDFPRTPVSNDAANWPGEILSAVAQQTGARIHLGNLFTTIKHAVTRFRITLHCYHADCVSPPPAGPDLEWIRPGRLTEYPLSVTGRRISLLLEESSGPHE
ncbi:A/G-specific adenine glycosylase [Lignipirellula cremea]|uniref:Adenine DNA glycosylase n=1 Tax=Lignipirellula cremea TaxID=2528010 RepID=A0A518DU50_9BACT|nr:A/G-specific adenine glycosylase [Lignipirellula cremea]QDU95361.1 A/G-specific adenine glycosylase [Lignipirellula cremea]